MAHLLNDCLKQDSLITSASGVQRYLSFPAEVRALKRCNTESSLSMTAFSIFCKQLCSSPLVSIYYLKVYCGSYLTLLPPQCKGCCVFLKVSLHGNFWVKLLIVFELCRFTSDCYFRLSCCLRAWMAGRSCRLHVDEANAYVPIHSSVRSAHLQFNRAMLIISLWHLVRIHWVMSECLIISHR